MLPPMCSQPACINMAVKIVTQSRPATMWAGTNDHLLIKASPPDNSSRKTRPLIKMMEMVTRGRCTGRREASPIGIIRFAPLQEKFSAIEENRPLGRGVQAGRQRLDDPTRLRPRGPGRLRRLADDFQLTGPVALGKQGYLGFRPSTPALG